MKRLVLLVVAGLTAMIVICLVTANAWADQISTDNAITDLQKKIDLAGAHWQAGRTTVSDMTSEEFDRLLGAKVSKEYRDWLAKQPRLAAKANLSFPTVFDWRDSLCLTPVKNQGNCGSCWDFAAVGAFEAAVNKRDHIEYDLSEQHVLSCNIYGGGCDGSTCEAVYDLFQRYGAVLESCLPYAPSSVPACSEVSCPPVVKIKGWQYIDTSVTAIKEAVLAGPVYTTFAVYQDFSYYTSGCYQHVSGNFRAYHAVVIVGWDDNACGTGQGAWICKNSWGSGWANLGGYFYIKWGNCGIGDGTILPLYPPDPVTLTVENTQFYGKPGDNTFLPGDTVGVTIALKNSGPQTATSVQATLTPSTSGLTMLRNTIDYPDIPAGESADADTIDFIFRIDSTATAGSRLDFVLNMTCSQGSFTGSAFTFSGKFDTVFSDNMELGSGSWTHGGTSDDWALGQPTGSCLTDPTSAHSGSYIWGNNLSSAYQAGCSNYLTSGTIDCSTISKSRLWFYRWLAVEKGIYDHARVYVNGNLVWQNDSSLDHIDCGWVFQDIDISAYADLNSSVTVRFALQSDAGLQLGGWNIDDFAVVGVRAYISGDANGDKKVNVADVVYLINYVFKSGTTPSPLLSGDANCDARVNVADAVYLINYIFKGGVAPACP